MAVSRRQFVPAKAAKVAPPIQYLTENGFSIIRLCDIDDSVTDTAQMCRFMVRSESGWEREITVGFDRNIIDQIQALRRTALLETSVLWLVCAELCLATYLWEKDDFPRDGNLTVSELPSDQILLATHWKDQRSD